MTFMELFAWWCVFCGFLGVSVVGAFIAILLIASIDRAKSIADSKVYFAELDYEDELWRKKQERKWLTK